MIAIEPLYNLINPEAGSWIVVLFIFILIFYKTRFWVASFLKMMYEIFIAKSPINS
jgi:hypothetical protein